MPVGNLEVPGIGKEVLMGAIWQSHALWAALIAGIFIIAPVSEYMGILTKQPKYDRFAKGAGVAAILLFATGSFTPILGVLILITLYPVFWSYAQNILFWPLFAEAFMFVGEIILIYAWYASWDTLAYRKKLHVVLGFMTGMLLIGQFSLIDVVASYLLTPTAATNLGQVAINPTYVPLNMHRFVGNISYAGFLVAGYAALRYLRSSGEADREYYDWMGHWGLIWGFGFVLLQPIIGYGYLKSIREHNAAAFDYIMVGEKKWLFLLVAFDLGIIAVASVAYCLHKLRFAVKPMPALRNLTLGALGFLTFFSVLNVIPPDGHLVPQIGLVFGEQTTSPTSQGDVHMAIPLGAMYPWKYLGLIGLMLVGLFVLGLYLKATAGGFHWGRASRWSQYALLITAVWAVLTMMTMGYTRETARRGSDPGFLISGCITLDQEVVAEGCPAAPTRTPAVGGAEA